jgi:hypothetical protein
MKIYKTYFDKSDTPFIQTFQPRRKYHVCWKRVPYKTFLGHNVVKIKLFGLFTIKKMPKRISKRMTALDNFLKE